MDSFENNNLIVSGTEQSNSSSDIGQNELSTLEPTHFSSLSDQYDESVIFPEHSLQIDNSSEFAVNPKIDHAELTEKGSFSHTPASILEYHSPPNESSTPNGIKKVQENPASLKRERSENWQHSETKLLLKLWEKYHDELKKYKRNSTVWDKMAQELRSNGFDRSAAQCKSRVRVLMAKYKSCFVDDVEDPEAIDSFDYFEELKRLISGNIPRTNNEPDHLMKSNSPLLYKSRSHGNHRANSRDNIGRAIDGERDKRGKLIEQLYDVIQHLIRRDEEEEEYFEAERQSRKRKHQEKLDSMAEKERHREERDQFKEEEFRKMIMVQNSMMISLIEAIKRS